MMAPQINTALELLREREKELCSELAQTRNDFAAKERAISDELRCLRAGMRGLLRQRGSVEDRSEQSKGPGQGGLTKEDVVALLAERLKSTGSADAEDLRDHVYAEAARQGRRRQGLHLQLKRALEDSRFTQVGSAWSLTGGRTQHVNETAPAATGA